MAVGLYDEQLCARAYLAIWFDIFSVEDLAVERLHYSLMVFQTLC